MLRNGFEISLGVVGLALVAFGVYGTVRGKFGETTSGGYRGGTISLPLSGVMVILGLGSLGFAGYLAANGTAPEQVAMPTGSASVPTTSPTAITPTSPIPTTESPTDTATPKVSSMMLTCNLSQKQLRPGMIVQLTYHVNSPVARQVGLGAGLYDEQGTDHSNGDGDVSSITLQQGWNSPSRSVTIPTDLPPGQYELDAEIWPANEIGQNGVNDLVDATCTYFNVP
jgi:hypothetical protein